MLRKTALAMAIAAIGSQAQAQAQDATQLGEITVSATRTERDTTNVPNTVSVYGAKKLEARDPKDLKDLLDNEVDLALRASAPRFSVATGAGRSGNESLNIRGLEGNQIAILVDGIRAPQNFSFGPIATSRTDYLDVDSLAGAEVLRGPASAQFGSDGLGGALVLRTLDPDDLLVQGKTRRSTAGFLRFGVASVDESAKATIAVAGESGAWQGLLLATERRGHETDNMGTNESPDARRTAPNPADTRSHSVLAKAGYKISATQRVMATLDARRRDVNTEVLSARTAPPATGNPASTAVIDFDARDRLDQERFSLEHRYEDLNAEWLQQLRTQVYVQHSRTRQFSAEDRYTAADRTRIGDYRENIAGLSTQGQTQLRGQRLSYGLDFSRNNVHGLRDGTVPTAGDPFPSKPFPDTRFTQTGAFVQDEIDVGDVSVIPALRYERFSLKPSTAGYTGTAVSLSDSAVTPRLGLVWRASPYAQPYLQWSQGFRAPSPDQVNNGFANPAQGYTSVGNPNLKPEHANSVELGLRGRISDFSWQLAAYDNRYRDFISQEVVGGTGAPNNPLIFQSINLASARIRGTEARFAWIALPGLTINGAIADTRGHSTKSGVQTPLDTVQPLRASLSARYEIGATEWTVAWQHADAKKPGTASTATYYLTPRYDVLDLGAAWKLSSSLRLAAMVNNVTDKKYWRWSDVRGIAATSTVLDAYTAPGREFQLSLRADF